MGSLLGFMEKYVESTAIPQFDRTSSRIDCDLLGIFWRKHSKVDRHTTKSQRRQVRLAGIKAVKYIGRALLNLIDESHSTHKAV